MLANLLSLSVHPVITLTYLIKVLMTGFLRYLSPLVAPSLCGSIKTEEGESLLSQVMTKTYAMAQCSLMVKRITQTGMI